MGSAGRRWGLGLIKGLGVTMRTLFRRGHTRQYPEQKPELPPRSRGVIALLEENCTSCMLCARECPDWCIYIDAHKETVEVPGAARPRQRNVLDRFAIDYSLCMYCSICIDVCPFDALYWSPEFEYSEYDIRDLLHEKDQLGGWMASVPPPPVNDPLGAPAKEVVAAQRATAKQVAASPDRTDRADRPAADSAADRASADRSDPEAELQKPTGQTGHQQPPRRKPDPGADE